MNICFPTERFRSSFINMLTEKYAFLRCKSIGRSVESRDIPCLCIGSEQGRSLLCGGFHGSEYLTVLTLLRLTEEICQSIEQRTDFEGFELFNLLSCRGVCIIPCVNPDGTEIAITDGCRRNWQANARGVDLNHNFDAGWQELKALEISMGITSPCRSRYGGESPESEPEVKALANFCRERNFESAYAFHSQGREIYCEYGEHTPQRGLKIARLLAGSSGYYISSPPKIATGGGFKDWAIEKLKIASMTIEIGLGENPLPLSDFEEEYSLIREMLCLCCLL